MNLVKLVPLMTVMALGYTQRDHVEKIATVPIDIAKIQATRYELSVVRRMFHLDIIGGKLPKNVERNFSAYLKKRLRSSGRDVSLDFWGKPYKMQQLHDVYQFWSYGPDRQDGSSDDIWAQLPKNF
jgi:hypothetical protein